MQQEEVQPDSSIIALNREYLLRVKSVEQGVTGEVILRNSSDTGEGTCIFAAPLQESLDELVAWSERALRAYKEG